MAATDTHSSDAEQPVFMLRFLADQVRGRQEPILLRFDPKPKRLASPPEPVRLAYLWRPVLSDAEDDMVLETAVNGRADLVMTFN